MPPFSLDMHPFPALPNAVKFLEVIMMGMWEEIENEATGLWKNVRIWKVLLQTMLGD